MLTCEKCGKPAPRLFDVLVSKRTHSSPAEYENWGSCCIAGDPDQDDERKALRGASDEQLERF